MKKNLFLRTDILPEEIPLLFSNKNLYLSFTEKKMNKPIIPLMINNQTTVPYYFDIPKDNSGEDSRKMSLLHPLAQLQAFQFILRYEQLILDFCSKSNFSVRSPIKRNIPKYHKKMAKEKELKRLSEEFSFLKETSVTSEEDEILFYNYFSYSKYKRITYLYKSPKFNRSKYKYNYYKKLDIQNFFLSIYTHALAWAVFGSKSIAKQYKMEDNVFANAIDYVSTLINFGETNGIVIGPEFSRVIAEVLLTRIDVLAESELKKKGRLLNKDYQIFRYLDDFFIFAQTKEEIREIKQVIQKTLSDYNLHINMHKSDLQERPILVDDGSVSSMKKIINNFEFSKLNYEISTHIRTKSLLKPRHERKGTINDWNELFIETENIIGLYESSRIRIVRYFLKAIREKVIIDNRHPYLLLKIIEIISNIYSLSINYVSTHSLLAIYTKIHNQSIDISKQADSNSNITEVENTELSAEQLNKLKSNQIIIEESVFHNSYNLLKNNFSKIDQMYEFLIFMKLLNKKLAASFLCAVLEKHKNSYFVLCSVAYYILDDSGKQTDHRYKTVIKKIEHLLKNYEANYLTKGTKSNILDGEYFYFINDFSYYPGFSDKIQKKYKNIIKNQYTSLVKVIVKSDQLKEQEGISFWKLITKSSYFNWQQKPEDFIRKLAKKSGFMDKIVEDY